MVCKSASSINLWNATWVAGAVGAGVDMDGAGGGSGTAGANIMAGGAEIVADDATWLLDGKVGAGLCFFSLS